MGESNGAWGELVEHDDELAALWDGFDPIPQPGENEALDAFVQRKRLTHGALVRLGARLADHTLLAFGGPGWIKYRDVVTDKRWAYAGSDWSKLKIVRAGAQPASCVIVAEGETDGARLSDAYDCDVAVLPAGAAYFPASYAAQLTGYEQVLVGLDNDAAGERGASKIMLALPQAQRFLPPAGDWCEAEVLPPLPPPPATRTHVGTIIFDDVASLMATGVPEPETLVDDLLYTEGVHVFSGHPGAGKTTLAMYCAILVMYEHRHVVWLDYENGIGPTVRRLLASDCPLSLAVDYFHYAGWPQQAHEQFPAIAEQWPGALVVVDSASKALQMQGLDENSPGEVTSWMVPIVRACKTHHLPVIVIDHVAKTATEKSRYARGASSKLADTDVQWYVDTVTPFNREAVGVIAVHQQKDREGFMPYLGYYQVGDGAGKLPIAPIDEPLTVAEPESDRPDPAI